jgi:hypothetical protein
MNTAPVILGNHGFFFRDGASFTVPTAGTAGRTSKPGAADTGWIDLGILSEATIQHEREERDIFAPTPGVMRLYDVIETRRQLSINLTAQEMSPLAFELLFGTLALTNASTQYNPLEGATKKGWLKLQQYGQNDAIFNTVDVFVQLKVSGELSFGDNIVAAKFEARVLHSTLNTGTLA